MNEENLSLEEDKKKETPQTDIETRNAKHLENKENLQQDSAERIQHETNVAPITPQISDPQQSIESTHSENVIDQSLDQSSLKLGKNQTPTSKQLRQCPSCQFTTKSAKILSNHLAKKHPELTTAPVEVKEKALTGKQLELTTAPEEEKALFKKNLELTKVPEKERISTRNHPKVADVDMEEEKNEPAKNVNKRPKDVKKFKQMRKCSRCAFKTASHEKFSSHLTKHNVKFPTETPCSQTLSRRMNLVYTCAWCPFKAINFARYSTHFVKYHIVENVTEKENTELQVTPARRGRGRPRKQKEEVLLMQIMLKKPSSNDSILSTSTTEENGSVNSESINLKRQRETDSGKVRFPVQNQYTEYSAKSPEQESENKIESLVSSEQKVKESLSLTYLLPARAVEVRCSKCCQFTATKLKSLAFHYKTCTGKKVETKPESKGSKLQCHKCKFETTDNDSFEAHQKGCSKEETKLTEKSVIQCSNCSFKTSKLMLLAVHYKSCAKPEVGKNVLQPRNVD